MVSRVVATGLWINGDEMLIQDAATLPLLKHSEAAGLCKCLSSFEFGVNLADKAVAGV
jgi:hypothetical protein